MGWAMDIQPQTTQAMSDDQELAKVLAGVSQQADEALQFEETAVATPAAVTTPLDEMPKPATVTETIQASPTANNTTATVIGYNPPSAELVGDLASIKKEALTELRPLVDKLDLAPQEKFDTYLLLLRSTDDKALIAPAYAAAQSITDESHKAQALLDIIKEIDYLSAPQT